MENRDLLIFWLVILTFGLLNVTLMGLLFYALYPKLGNFG